jgi:precorrin-2 dehydrogenase / sirohydrochlorin ferrochelatase
MIVDLNLKHRNVIVIGAGQEGTKRISSLSNEGCQIIVISDKVNEALYEIEGSTYPIILIRRRITDIKFLHTFDNIFLILAATDDPCLNEAIVEEAKKKKILSYTINGSTLGDLFFTSIINIEETIQISISTAGKSPLMSKIIKDKVENTIKNIIGPTDIENIRIQEFAREKVKKYIKNQQERRKFLYSLVKDQEIQELISKKNIDKVKERIIKILDKWEDNKIG